MKMVARALLAAVAVGLIAASMASSAALTEELMGLPMLQPPPRPTRFKNSAELRTYLSALRDYYAVIGRPRFGKRSATHPIEALIQQARQMADSFAPDYLEREPVQKRDVSSQKEESRVTRMT